MFNAHFSPVSSILLNTWSRTIQPDAINLDSRASLISWGIAFLAAVTVGVYYTRTYQNKAEGVEESPLLENQILILGFYALLLGMAPSWAVGHQASSQGPFDNRYALPAMLGASLIVSGFVHSLRSPVYRTLILALLVGLAVGANFRSGNDYRWDWTYQQRFFWQLYWRAPTLKPNTFILSDTEIFKYESARIDLGPALNVLYPAQPTKTGPDYWAFTLEHLMDGLHITSDQLTNGAVVYQSLRTLNYTAPSHNGIAFSYLAGKPRCLWVIMPVDINYPYWSERASILPAISNPGQILSEPIDATYPDPTIFGPEPPYEWCYYFQKASLARQFGDWETVGQLGAEALSLGYMPSDPYEWMPFLEGYIHIKDWEMAERLSQQALVEDRNLQTAVCATWTRALETARLSEDEQSTVNLILAEIGCSSP